MTSSDKIKIILIDDDKFLLDMYAGKFEKQGLEVYTSSSSTDALNKFRDGFTADIILLDIIMPTMDGLELLEIMRKEKLAENAVVVMLTNQADNEESAHKLNIDGFIVKAMTIPSEVVSMVLDLYNKKKK